MRTGLTSEPSSGGEDGKLRASGFRSVIDFHRNRLHPAVSYQKQWMAGEKCSEIPCSYNHMDRAAG